MSLTTLELINVTKIIGKRKIIDSLSLQINEGEVFGLLGPNGAGKTTTIRMLVGLMKLTSGQVKINGFDVEKQFEQAMMHVGAIVENPEMYKYLTGYQNLLHYARMMPGVTRERINEVIAIVGLEHRIHEKVKQYSLGMRQRLGVAQALLHRPKLLVLDEPTNGLDPAGIREMRDYLRKLAREEGTSIIVSSHLLTEMELMCDRVAIIQTGKLLDIKSIRNANTQEQLQMAFEVSNLDRAQHVLEQIAKEHHVKLSNINLDHGTIVVAGAKTSMAAYNRALVLAEVEVYSIQTQHTTLEDQFLEMTGGEGIV